MRDALKAFKNLEELAICFPECDFMPVQYEADSRLLRHVLESFEDLPKLKHVYKEDEVVNEVADGGKYYHGWDRITTAFAVAGKSLEKRRNLDSGDSLMIERCLIPGGIEKRNEGCLPEDYLDLLGPWSKFDVRTVMRAVDPK